MSSYFGQISFGLVGRPLVECCVLAAARRQASPPLMSWAQDLSGKVQNQHPLYWAWKQELLLLSHLITMVFRVGGPHLPKTTRTVADLPLPKVGPIPHSPKSWIAPSTPLFLHVAVLLSMSPPGRLQSDQVRNRAISTVISL